MTIAAGGLTPADADGRLYRYAGEVCRFSWNGDENFSGAMAEVCYVDPGGDHLLECDENGFTDSIISFEDDVRPNLMPETGVAS